MATINTALEAAGRPKAELNEGRAVYAMLHFNSGTLSGPDGDVEWVQHPRWFEVMSVAPTLEAGLTELRTPLLRYMLYLYYTCRYASQTIPLWLRDNRSFIKNLQSIRSTIEPSLTRDGSVLASCIEGSGRSLHMWSSGLEPILNDVDKEVTITGRVDYDSLRADEQIPTIWTAIWRAYLNQDSRMKSSFDTTSFTRYAPIVPSQLFTAIISQTFLFSMLPIARGFVLIGLLEMVDEFPHLNDGIRSHVLSLFEKYGLTSLLDFDLPISHFPLVLSGMIHSYYGTPHHTILIAKLLALY